MSKKKIDQRRFAARVRKHKYGVKLMPFVEFAPTTLWMVERITKTNIRIFEGFTSRKDADIFVEILTEGGWSKARIVGRYVWYVAEDQAPKKRSKR